MITFSPHKKFSFSITSIPKTIKLSSFTYQKHLQIQASTMYKSLKYNKIHVTCSYGKCLSWHQKILYNIRRMLWKKVFNSNTFELLTPFKHKFVDRYGASLYKWGVVSFIFGDVVLFFLEIWSEFNENFRCGQLGWPDFYWIYVQNLSNLLKITWMFFFLISKILDCKINPGKVCSILTRNSTYSGQNLAKPVNNSKCIEFHHHNLPPSFIFKTFDPNG